MEDRGRIVVDGDDVMDDGRGLVAETVRKPLVRLRANSVFMLFAL